MYGTVTEHWARVIEDRVIHPSWCHLLACPPARSPVCGLNDITAPTRDRSQLSTSCRKDNDQSMDQPIIRSPACRNSLADSRKNLQMWLRRWLLPSCKISSVSSPCARPFASKCLGRFFGSSTSLQSRGPLKSRQQTYLRPYDFFQNCLLVPILIGLQSINQSVVY